MDSIKKQTKKCYRCKKIKSLKLFHNDKRSTGCRMSICKFCRVVTIKEYHIQNKNKIHQYKQKSWREWSKTFKEYKRTLFCDQCGVSGKDHPTIIDFHHRNPNQKKFSIGDKADSFPSKEILNEIKKCDILCANCHRIIHETEEVILWEPY